MEWTGEGCPLPERREGAGFVELVHWKCSSWGSPMGCERVCPTAGLRKQMGKPSSGHSYFKLCILHLLPRAQTCSQSCCLPKISQDFGRGSAQPCLAWPRLSHLFSCAGVPAGEGWMSPGGKGVANPAKIPPCQRKLLPLSALWWEFYILSFGCSKRSQCGI